MIPEFSQVIKLPCPDPNCGARAIPCSLDNVLNFREFTCDACGESFIGTSNPLWLENVKESFKGKNNEEVFQRILHFYNYIYRSIPLPDSENNVIVKILIDNPKYVELFRFCNFSTVLQHEIIKKQPNILSYIDLSKLNSELWLLVICQKPTYASKCPWTAVSRYVVESSQALPAALHQNKELIFTNSGLDADKKFSSSATEDKYDIFKPILFARKMKWVEHLNWQAFCTDDIFSAFKEYPELLSNYPFTNENVDSFNWRQYDSGNWERAVNIIPRHSPLAKIYSLISGNNVESILKSNPQWSKYCDWNMISSADWLHMVLGSSQWVLHCQWHKFNSSQWLSILKNKPEHTSHCSWNIFTYSDWLEVFKLNIGYAQHCDWSKFSSQNWVEVLKLHPELSKHCRWSVLTTSDWIRLFQINRNYASKCSRWGNFNTSEWLTLFDIDSTFEEKCECWNSFSSSQWIHLLEKHPDFSRHCNWRSLRSNDWIKILTNDLIDRAGYETQYGTITEDWERTFNYGALRHPEYLAIFSLLNAAGVVEALKRFPNLENNYLDWDKVGSDEWLLCLAEDAKWASKCTAKHWRKILDFVNNLPNEKRHSVKNINSQLWEHRLEVLDAANRAEIARLSSEEFYTLIDFMDWEWDSHFSWAALDKEQVLEIAKKHPEFMERYGFERISNDEMTQLLISSPEFANYCLEKSKGNDDVAKKILKLFNHDTLAGLFAVHPELYPKFKPYFSLTLKDRIGFKYYGIDQLRSKVAFYRLFVTQIVMFLFGWIFLYFGECGYKAFSGEHPKEAQTAMYAYVGFALVWSLVQAKLHEYCGKGILSRFLGITQGMFGVILFGYSFFLTNLTRPDYLMAIGIYGVYMLFMRFCHHCVAKKMKRLETGTSGPSTPPPVPPIPAPSASVAPSHVPPSHSSAHKSSSDSEPIPLKTAPSIQPSASPSKSSCLTLKKSKDSEPTSSFGEGISLSIKKSSEPASTPSSTPSSLSVSEGGTMKLKSPSEAAPIIPSDDAPRLSLKRPSDAPPSIPSGGAIRLKLKCLSP